MVMHLVAVLFNEARGIVLSSMMRRTSLSTFPVCPLMLVVLLSSESRNTFAFRSRYRPWGPAPGSYRNGVTMLPRDGVARLEVVTGTSGICS